MSFTPVNEDHSIQGAAFALTLSVPFSKPLIERLRAEPAVWRKELPGTDLANSVELQVNAVTQMPRPVVTLGIEFSNKRPDGVAVEQLRFMGSDVVFETTRYTRWTPTWEKARLNLSAAAKRVIELEPEPSRSVVACAFAVVDEFRSADLEAMPEGLFSRSQGALPAALYEQGSLWHCHTGWFRDTDDARILHNLNIDSRRAKDVDPVTGSQSERLTISISHNQTFRFTSPHSLGTDEVMQQLDKAFDEMHRLNKLQVNLLLTDEMRDRIGVR